MTLAGRFLLIILVAGCLCSAEAVKPSKRNARDTTPQADLQPANATATGERAKWQIEDAPFRATVRLEFTGDIPETGIAINLPEFGYTLPNSADIVMMDGEGKILPLAIVWRGEGQSVLMLAQEMKKGADYFIYFGGKKPRGGKPWTPMLSLFLETRRVAPGAKVDSASAVHSLWQQNTPADGAGWATSIYHGANPFGESETFLSHFTGYLRPEKIKSALFYTLSSDASFVYFNGNLEFGWPGIHAAHGTEKNYHGKVINLSGPYVKVDYYQAKVSNEGPGAAMVLGWKHQGKFETVPSDVWLHPGSSKIVRLENVQGLPVAVPEVRIDSHVGYGGEWLCEASCSIPGFYAQGWKPQWEFDDGAVITEPSFQRVTIGTAPHKVLLRLRKDKDEVTGVRRFGFTPKSVQESIQNDGDARHYDEMIYLEDPNRIPAKSLHAYLVFLEAFGTDPQVAKFAEVYLKRADSTDPLWLKAQLARLRTIAETDPKQGLNELRKVDPAARHRFSRAFDIFELDLLVFLLHDFSVLDRAQVIGLQSPGSDINRIAAIRIGDLYRLQGKMPQAIEQYRSVQKSISEETAGRKLPAQDSAYSIDVNKLLDDGYRVEAEDKLLEWELHHPMAKLNTDFLVLNARLMMMSGRWREARQELESFQKLQPQGPYQIDVDFYRARAMFELGEKDAARQIWQDIAKQYPNHPLAGPSLEWTRKK